MTVVSEYVTALLEYIGFLLQGVHRPKSSGVVSTAYAEYVYLPSILLILGLSVCTVQLRKLTPYLHAY